MIAHGDVPLNASDQRPMGHLVLGSELQHRVRIALVEAQPFPPPRSGFPSCG